jgi:hypothetical protein
MSTIPVRQLGSAGVVTDVAPADLESASVFTAAVNVRFRNGKASRAPVPRTIRALPFEPGHVLTIPPSSGGADEIVLLAADFSSVQRLNGSSLEDLSPAGMAGGGSEAPITSCFLGGVSYINRESSIPYAKAPGDSTYGELPGWDPAWRCRVMRAYKDQLIALGVTLDGAFYPTMVKWSDLTGFGAPPPSWDVTSTTNSAGQNIINEMRQEIVDGLTLRDSFIVYSTDSVWSMDYIGGNEIYGFRKLFDEYGAISPNCVVQVGGLHYVFDRNDIYVHDGVAPRSIADGKTREFIFGALDFGRSDLCFVALNSRLSEIMFCYPSFDRLTGFASTSDGCNRAAVYNYANGTWTFYDLPNVTGWTKAAIQGSASWESDPEVSWDGAAGLFSTTEGDEDRHFLLIGRSHLTAGITAPRLYGFDLVNGGRLPFPAEPQTLRPAFLERVGIDLDSIGKNLTQYTHLQAIWPQAAFDTPAECYWQFGANDLVNAEPVWSEPLNFDPRIEGKIDIREAGKYLSYRLAVNGDGDFQLTGFDVQLVIRGRR